MEEKIDLSESKLLLEGSEEERKEKLKEISQLRDELKSDQQKRRSLYKKRYDFYTGNQDSYTTIVGKTSGRKTGHSSAVHNYTGKSAKKMVYALANNPPATTIPARRAVHEDFVEDERRKAQAVENFVEDVFERNSFWLNSYRRAVSNQVIVGDAAIKTYPFFDGESWDIKIQNHEKMDKVMVAWRGDNITEYDAVLVEEVRTIASIEREFGVKIPKRLAMDETDDKESSVRSSNWAEGKLWESGSEMPDGKTNAPSVILSEYDDMDYYCLMVGNEFIQFVYKDGETYPKMRFWDFVHNIPQPGSSWSISDIDDMIQPQIEFNEASNEERSYIRVGAAQKFVAYNMDDFDPESIKTGSGGVIFVDSPDNTSRFEPLPTNVNVFPIDSYLNRIQSILFDMGVPKVAFGSGGADSGRSKAIDYQSLVDLIDFKHDCWELALTSIVKKIQLLGDFYFGSDEDGIPGVDFFKDPISGQFVYRYPEFDWSEVMPVTAADKVVNVLNKFTMGLPFRYAFKEMGYRDVEAVINEMKREAEDEDLMAFRAKMYQVTDGLVGAQQRAQQQMQEMNAAPPAPNPNQAAPVMTPQDGGLGTPQPASQRGGTTAYSSPKGFLARQQQNLQAQGR